MWLPHGAVPRDDPFSVSGDLHGLMGGAPPEIRPTGDIAAWYQKLCTSSSGVLYEDTYLQVLTCPALSHPSTLQCHRFCRSSFRHQACPL